MSCKNDLKVGQYISVKIEQFLPEVFVVSFVLDEKTYQGVLLDSSKRNSLTGVPNKDKESDLPDVKYSVLQQRHTLCQQNLRDRHHQNNKPVTVNKNKNSRMTVRLRPRQVLCSNCQSVCNENSKTVGPFKASKSLDNTKVLTGHRKLKELRNTSPKKGKNGTASPSLVPKLIKLKASEIETATNGSASPSSIQEYSAKTSEKLDSEKLLKIAGQPNSIGSNRRNNRIPKMTIATSNIKKIEPTNQSKTSKLIKTRSRVSSDEQIKDLGLATQISKTASEISVNQAKILKLAISSKKLDHCLSLNGSKPQENLLLLCQSSGKGSKLDKMILRKKRSIGMMEDLWGENMLEENKKLKTDKDSTSKTNDTTDKESSVIEVSGSEKPKTTPILKISFGPGRGTVLKIPAKSTEGSETDIESHPQKLEISKAARKALKRARKEAQKKSTFPTSLLTKFGVGGKSPMRIGGISPARLTSFSSGRFSGASPGRFGGASPGRFGGASPARFNCSPRAYTDSLMSTSSKRHKHKMKHKKKHKEDRKHKSSDENKEPENEFMTPLESSTQLLESADIYIPKNSSPKGKLCDSVDWKIPQSTTSQNCLQNSRHKLSISIKRVNNASYIACDPSGNAKTDSDDNKFVCLNSPTENEVVSLRNKLPFTEMTKPVIGNHFNYLNISPDRDSNSDSYQSSDESSDIPDFPCVISDQPLIENRGSEAILFLNGNYLDVESCDSGSEIMKVGEVVWGKINEALWWPAKITGLKVKHERCALQRIFKEAYVDWYGSSISSFVPIHTLQPFLKNFNRNYNKRKPGLYQDAVRQANCDASFDNGDSIVSVCESPISASPREVDVAS